jgi:hypothetical protein
MRIFVSPEKGNIPDIGRFPFVIGEKNVGSGYVNDAGFAEDDMQLYGGNV